MRRLGEAKIESDCLRLNPIVLWHDCGTVVARRLCRRLDVEGWSAVGETYAEVVKLAEEGIPFALKHPAELEHYVPAGERIPA